MLHTDLPFIPILMGIILIFYANLVCFRFFSKLIFHLHVQKLSVFFFLIRSTRSIDSLHRRINTDNIVRSYRYYFLLHIIKCGIEIDINTLVVTIPNFDSARLFTLSFICLHYLLSTFKSRLHHYFQ